MGLANYQRFLEMQILGQYISPHTLNITFGYDFGPLQDQVEIAPANGSGAWGSDQLYGQTSPYGGPLVLEQWRIQQSTQKCQSFQMQLEEVSVSENSAGAGLTLSAITAVVGINRGYRPIKAANSAGTNG